ncbi:calcium/sodium antiporter [Fodinicurvata sp. EGI_FJ10296]|uniref:calcium/sodium antiporter n=1 Tax=Fodinicurvata sp. EGI_FJ10296 TaxID=3231908 RepID=UPI0034529515
MSVYLELLLGLILLVAGGDALVRGAVALARRFGISPLLIGLTLVGFGTSTPELVTSIQAAFAGSPGIAVGNVVGSNIANILLILGVAAVISPLVVARAAFLRDGTVSVLVAVLCVGMILVGDLGRVVGLVSVGLLAAYVIYTYRAERVGSSPSAVVHQSEATLAEPGPRSVWVAAAFTVGGLVLTIVGARFLVSGAIDLSQAAGVPETVVGLTVVAIGTSLPELVTSIIAALRRQSDVALGNIIGSNIYNVLGILGVTAIVHPISVPPSIAAVDVWVMLAATLGMVAFAVTGSRISRAEGGIFVAAYIGYVGYLVASL